MLYLDYCATTPVNKKVLDTFNEVSLNYIGNPNSLHKLGKESNELIENATKEIASLLNIKKEELIYTSGASESNNLAIKGIAFKYQNRGKHIITTMLEHSSIIGPLSYLQQQGFEIDFVNILDTGLVDLNHLKTLIRDDTILISICAVDSELGIRQPVEEIGLLLKNYPNLFFHVDITQCLGKDKIDLSNIDLASFSAHKIYGLKGIGGLIKKESIMLEPLIHGGKSTTVYRSGTPPIGLIVSLKEALKLILNEIDNNKIYVSNLNKKIRSYLIKHNNIVINSTNYAIPNVINFSIKDIQREVFRDKLAKDNIYISMQSACSNENALSKPVYAVTKDEDRSLSSLRISLSHLTKEKDLDILFKSFDKHLR